MRMFLIQFALLGLFVMSDEVTHAADVRVAVASNFHTTAKKIAGKFERATNHRVLLSAGSTGKHFAQIIHGAPFDLLIAADQARPLELEKRGLVTTKSRRTYAFGRLVLWQPAGLKSPQLRPNLVSTYRKLAIANPRLAPYGRAAIEVLDALHLTKNLKSKLVRGENIAQAYQFVASGNAELGLVALSQMDRSLEGGYLLVPRELHQPIEQQMVLLSDSDAAAALFNYMSEPEILQLIRQSGYDTEDE